MTALTTAPFALLQCRFCGTHWGAIGVVIPSACVTCDRRDWILVHDDRPPSNWSDATTKDLDTLQLEILLLRESYELRGTWLTARDLQRALRHPGS